MRSHLISQIIKVQKKIWKYYFSPKELTRIKKTHRTDIDECLKHLFSTPAAQWDNPENFIKY